jgi:hypothetical protein
MAHVADESGFLGPHIEAFEQSVNFRALVDHTAAQHFEMIANLEGDGLWHHMGFRRTAQNHKTQPRR